MRFRKSAYRPFNGSRGYRTNRFVKGKRKASVIHMKFIRRGIFK